LPLEKQQEITDYAQSLVDNGTYKSLGEALYNSDLDYGAYSCARCHTQGWSYGDPGQPAQGAMGPNLTAGASASHFPSEADQVAFITKGSELGKKYGIQGQGSGRMPGFGNLLTQEQIKLIVEYVRSL
jgi:mono/diheme cytochrome c family protein